MAWSSLKCLAEANLPESATSVMKGDFTCWLNMHIPHLPEAKACNDHDGGEGVTAEWCFVIHFQAISMSTHTADQHVRMRQGMFLSRCCGGVS